MIHTFSRIGLTGKYTDTAVQASMYRLIDFLKSARKTVILATDCAAALANHACQVHPAEQFPAACDLMLVVGGDGSLLKAARAAVEHGVPLVGINRGQLGFLADISPADMEDHLTKIFEGHYRSEQRFLLQADIFQKNKRLRSGTALNDVVLSPKSIARMLTFNVHVDGELIYSQRSDGLIVATPTGSTAYALSGGGPILHPQLDALVLVPMHPHTLSCRPIVLSAQSTLTIQMVGTDSIEPKVSCDSQIHLDMASQDLLKIYRVKRPLTLIHPKNYDYYATLRSKLGLGRFER